VGPERRVKTGTEEVTGRKKQDISQAVEAKLKHMCAEVRFLLIIGQQMGKCEAKFTKNYVKKDMIYVI